MLSIHSYVIWRRWINLSRESFTSIPESKEANRIRKSLLLVGIWTTKVVSIDSQSTCRKALMYFSEKKILSNNNK